jgi:hypothetical protein
MKSIPARQFKARYLRVFGCVSGTARIVGDVEAPVLDAKAWGAIGRGVPARWAKRTRSRRATR